MGPGIPGTGTFGGFLLAESQLTTPARPAISTSAPATPTNNNGDAPLLWGTTMTAVPTGRRGSGVPSRSMKALVPQYVQVTKSRAGSSFTCPPQLGQRALTRRAMGEDCRSAGAVVRYPRPVTPAVASIPAGTIIGGDFRISAPLSAGGMGAVYVAEQISTGKRRALKVMHPALVADPGLRERFVQEAKVGSLIASDHVVEVVGAGVDATLGVPWIAMELLDGRDLAHELPERGPMSVEEAVAVLRPLCHALSAAHAAGIVHRDVKPENVFLAATQSTSHPTVVKVLDFGIAKVAAQARQTATAAMGTPLWMAPEQTEISAKVSPATDVWALGLIGYWLLTGRPYWRAANAAEASMPALMREILFEPLDPPSARAGEIGFGARIPAGFDAWFARCTVRDPAARYATAGEAFAALLSLLGMPPSASFHPPPAPSGSVMPMSQAPPTAVSPMGGTLPLSQHVGSVHPPSMSPGHSTAAPTSQALVAAPKRSRSGLLFALLGGGVVLLVVAAIGLFLMLRTNHRVRRHPRPVVAESLRHRRRPPEPPPPTASGEAAPDAPTAKTRRPRVGAPAPAAPASAKPAEPGPFDAVGAQRKLEIASQSASYACKAQKGPSALAATAVFAPSGYVKMVQMPLKDSLTGRGQCFKVRILAVHVAPFSGGPQSVGTSVSFGD